MSPAYLSGLTFGSIMKLTFLFNYAECLCQCNHFFSSPMFCFSNDHSCVRSYEKQDTNRNVWQLMTKNEQTWMNSTIMFRFRLLLTGDVLKTLRIFIASVCGAVWVPAPRSGWTRCDLLQCVLQAGWREALHVSFLILEREVRCLINLFQEQLVSVSFNCTDIAVPFWSIGGSCPTVFICIL